MILGALVLGQLLHRGRRGRVTLAKFAQRRAGLLGIAERGERLPQPHHAFRRPRPFGIVGCDLEKLFGGLAGTRALKIGLADVEDRVRAQAMRGIGGEKRLESGLRLWILPRLKGLQRGVVLLTRLIEHRNPGADDCWSARLRGGRRPFAEFERGAGGRLLTRQGRRGLAYERGAWRSRSQRPRRARRVWIGVRIECVRPPWSDGWLVADQRCLGDVRVRRCASGAIAKPEFNA